MLARVLPISFHHSAPSTRFVQTGGHWRDPSESFHEATRLGATSRLRSGVVRAHSRRKPFRQIGVLACSMSIVLWPDSTNGQNSRCLSSHVQAPVRAIHIISSSYSRIASNEPPFFPPLSLPMNLGKIGISTKETVAVARRVTHEDRRVVVASQVQLAQADQLRKQPKLFLDHPRQPTAALTRRFAKSVAGAEDREQGAANP